MKYVISTYNQDVEWAKEYTDDIVVYDRSDARPPVEGAIVVPNIGSDLYDKFTWIIDNYENLPDVVLLTKANLFKYITKEEFEKVKDNTTFTPLLTQNHETYSDELGIVNYYDNGLYYERNNDWYLSQFPPIKTNLLKLKLFLQTADVPYVGFAPGSNYILPKEHILKHPKDTYEDLRWILNYDVYPAEAQTIERGLYNLWR